MSSASLIYAVGDIHGCDRLLERLLARIRDDAEKREPEDTPLIVFLGDYVDRGPGSRQVIDRLMRGEPDFRTVCLLGNHEALMMDCLDTDDEDVWLNWLVNGGVDTLQSFNTAFNPKSFDPAGLRDKLGNARIDWLKALKPYHVEGAHLFVHAGVAPGKPLEEQHLKDLIWIRNRFLDSDLDHGYRVIHGHTPTDEPEVRPNRINVDTGAVYGGDLTAVILSDNPFPEFLSVEFGG